MTNFPSPVNFKISSYCSFGNCVEVGRSPQGPIVMRDTKDRTQQALAFSDVDWTAFVVDVKAGQFDFA